jgi:hypothetical protein
MDRFCNRHADYCIELFWGMISEIVLDIEGDVLREFWGWLRWGGELKIDVFERIGWLVGILGMG